MWWIRCEDGAPWMPYAERGAFPAGVQMLFSDTDPNEATR